MAAPLSGQGGNMTVAPIIQRCEALFDDLHFNAVKEWKAAKPGRKATGLAP